MILSKDRENRAKMRLSLSQVLTIILCKYVSADENKGSTMK